MGIIKHRNLFLTIKNSSGMTLQTTEILAVDGDLEDIKNSQIQIPNGDSILIKANRSISYGPKVVVRIQGVSKDSFGHQFKMLVYTELSISSDNPMCCYAIPDGEYIFEGMTKRYGFYHDAENTKPITSVDNVENFYTTVEIGLPVLCTRFYHISDTHIGYEYDDASHNNINFEVTDAVIDEEYNWHKQVIKAIMDDANGETALYTRNMSNLLGVIHTGDIFGSFDTNNGTLDDGLVQKTFNKYFKGVYKKLYSRPNHFLRDTDLAENDYLNSHLFEGVGNHDDCCTPPNKNEVWNDIVDRNKRAWHNDSDTLDSRMPSAIYDSTRRLYEGAAHYYWDWYGVRFIQINFSVVDGLCSDTGTYKTYGYNSYDYLQQVLSKSKNMPVIICSHVSPDNTRDSFIDEKSRVAFNDILRNNKNIIAVFNGHSHKTGLTKYTLENGDTIPCYDAGRVIGIKESNTRSGYFLRYTFLDFGNTKQICCEKMKLIIKRQTDESRGKTENQYTYTLSKAESYDAIIIKNDRTK